ncbi:MAG: radical SAM protein [Deltaproteobacteria bacterium]|nr:radical SAM protein [Deltaproteobacteria bacterium]
MRSGRFEIGPLLGGGVVLGYRCSSRCRHCLYGCGPHRKDGQPSPEELDRLLDDLARLAPRARYHIGGGEPFLDRGLLHMAVEGMRARGLLLEYVETNAAWVDGRAQAEEILSELAAVGLACILVSLSPFHAEFVPYARTSDLIRAAERVLPGGAFVWIPGFAPDLEGQPQDRPLDLERLLEERGDRYARGLAVRYGLVAAGRAGRFLARHGQRFGWRELVGRAPCRERLADTRHFHVDGQGWYVPGLCAGLVLPWSELAGPIDLARYPVIDCLLQSGLAGLVERACGSGFEPLADGYSSPCDLCTHVRVFFFQREPSPDLGPPGFYMPASLPELVFCAQKD